MIFSPSNDTPYWRLLVRFGAGTTEKVVRNRVWYREQYSTNRIIWAIPEIPFRVMGWESTSKPEHDVVWRKYFTTDWCAAFYFEKVRGTYGYQCSPLRIRGDTDKARYDLAEAYLRYT